MFSVEPYSRHADCCLRINPHGVGRTEDASVSPKSPQSLPETPPNQWAAHEMWVEELGVPNQPSRLARSGESKGYPECSIQSARSKYGNRNPNVSSTLSDPAPPQSLL